jgi:hypothetical protein
MPKQRERCLVGNLFKLNLLVLAQLFFVENLRIEKMKPWKFCGKTISSGVAF